MSSKLSIDILSIIFEELEKENSTLYSCIFVNREWCQIVIPFLWKNPWKRIDDYQNNGANKYKILFKCFSMMMPRESKEFLKMNRINFLNEDSSFQSNISSSQSPLFNYASFLKVIDSLKINNMINHNIKGSKLRYLVEQEILKLLISNTSKLKCLRLYNSHPITSFLNSSISLSQLNELHCYTSIDAAVFYGLSRLCKNIEKLVIEGDNVDNHGLILLIEQQINLKRVKIWEEEEGIFGCAPHNNLGEAIATRSSSIIELDLENYAITIPLRKFQNNLIIFKFTIDYEIFTIEFENILKNISFPNLQQLIVYDYCPSFSIMANMIEKTNGDLRKISIGTCFYEDEDADMFVSAIAKHCPKLELLAVEIDSLNEVTELIRKCKKLRALVLRSYYRKGVIELFKVLSNNASNQLRELQLDSSWKLSKEALNEFFESWKQQGRSSLDFYIYSYTFRGEYEDIIKKYQEMGVIRKFDKYVGTFNILDNWE